VTLPPGSALPSDGECAARVRPTAEIRPQNATYNARRGHADTSQPGTYARVTGNFTGTTDEIIQWAACKWGFDEDVVRAQTAKESWWSQRSGGDLTGDASLCPPGHGIGVDGHPGQCPESWGVQQVRYPYFRWAFMDALDSTAYNLDVALAARRSCYEGYETWLNTVDRGRDYAKGDLWGCVGMWFSGRWYTQPAVDYIAAVQGYLNQRIWTTPDFIGFRG
jgi:autotransporter family porin